MDKLEAYRDGERIWRLVAKHVAGDGHMNTLIKYSVVEELGLKGKYSTACPACEVAGKDCDRCPLASLWGNNCIFGLNSPYALFRQGEGTVEAATRIADAFKELADKEAHDAEDHK